MEVLMTIHDTGDEEKTPSTSKQGILIKLGFPVFGQIPSLMKIDGFGLLGDGIWAEAQHES
ncbi:hypothetical protein LINPERHAP2_LOCUS12075 [Linum perenne]